MTKKKYLTIDLKGYYPIKWRYECLNLLWALDREGFIEIRAIGFDKNCKPIEVTIQEAKE
jgi:hypothetical protein